MGIVFTTPSRYIDGASIDLRPLGHGAIEVVATAQVSGSESHILHGVARDGLTGSICRNSLQGRDKAHTTAPEFFLEFLTEETGNTVTLYLRVAIMHNTQMLIAGILHLLEEGIQICLIIIGQIQTGRIGPAIVVELLHLLRLQCGQTLFHNLLGRQDNYTIRVNGLLRNIQHL